MAKVFTCSLQKHFKWVLLYIFALNDKLQQLQTSFYSQMWVLLLTSKMFWKPRQFKSYVADIKWNADRRTAFQSYNREIHQTFP